MVGFILCQGESVNVCGENFNMQGQFTKICSGVAANGCDSVYTVNIAMNPTTAFIATPAQIDCNTPCVTLNASASLGGTSTTYTWSSNISGPAGLSTASACQTGTFTVTVTGTFTVPVLGTKVCSDTAQVQVSSSSSSVPAQPGIISGNPTPCAGASLGYTIATVPTATSYTWQFPAGATITGQGTNFINIVWGSAAPSGTIQVMANNSCGSSPAATLNINGNSTPATPGIITGNTTPCGGSAVGYSIAAVSGATNYQWTAPGNGAILNQGTTNPTVTWGANPNVTLSVTASNACGTSPAATLAINGIATPAQPGAIAGLSTVCGNTNNVAYSISNIVGADAYTWSVPASATIVSGQGTNTLTLNWGASPSGTISVLASNACGNSAPSNLAIVGTSAPVTPMLTGATSICGNSTENYTVSNAAVGVTYTWSVPASGTLNSGQGTGNISVAWGAIPSGTLSVVASNTCATLPAVTIPITGGGNPSVPAGVSGPFSVCPNSVTVYSVVNPSGGNTYNWVVPGSGTLVSGQGTNSISISWGANPNGAISVSATNSCGNSPSASLGVATGSLPAPPAIINGSADVCSAGTQPYSVPTVVGATSYTWSVTNGGTISNGQNTTQVDITLLAGNSIVSCTANNACGSSAATTLAVNTGSAFSAEAGSSQVLCGLSTILAATAPASGTGEWGLISGPGALSFSDDAAANANISVNLPGVYVLSWTVTDGNCVASDDVQITFTAPIDVSNLVEGCNSNGTTSTVSFDILNGTAPYTVVLTSNGVNAGTVVGNLFTSNMFTPGLYNFTVDDAGSCAPLVVTGNVVCDCLTDAGQMPADTLRGCIGKVVCAQVIAGSTVIDANDIGEYVLHALSGNTLGPIIARNASGCFPFFPGLMTLGQVYYITYVVGDNNGSNQAILAGCFDIAIGQPIVFYPAPTSDSGPDQTVCGITTQLAAVSAFGGEWSQVSGPDVVVFSDPTSPTSAVTVNVGGDYTFAWNEILGGCEDTSQMRIAFFQLPQVSPEVYDCNPTGTAYTFTFDFVYGNAPFTVIDIITGLTAGTLDDLDFTSDVYPSGAQHNLQVVDLNGCTVDIVDSYTCGCVSDAGSMPTGILNSCGSVSTATTNEVLDPDDDINYILHTNSTGTVGTILDQNTVGTFAFDASDMSYGTTYYISAVVGNADGFGGIDFLDPCTDIAPGQPVVFNEPPVVSANASNTNACSLTVDLLGNSTIGIGSWSMTAGAGIANFSNANTAVTSVTVSQAGEYSFRYTVSNTGCTDSASVNITFAAPLVVTAIDENCTPTGDQYILSFIVTGGTMPYTVDNNPLTGISYTSALIASGGSYNFVVDDASVCPAIDVQGDYTCDCLTQIGTLAPDATTFCGNAPATATYTGPDNLDPTDVLEFVLHTGSLNDILFHNNTPSFTFQAPLQYNTTYYITGLAGNDNGAGQVDINTDGCMQNTIGVPIQFIETPSASLSAPAQSCAGICINANLTIGGSSNSYVIFFDNGTNLTVTQDTVIQICPATDTTICLINVVETNGCTATASACANITVSPAAFAGTVNGVFELCANINTPSALADKLTGEVAGGIWIETSGTPSTGTGFDATTGTFTPFGQDAGVYTFQYLVTGVPPCSDDTESVTCIVNDPPFVNAGADDTLTCVTQSIQIGNNIPDPNISYSWTTSGAPFSALPNPVVFLDGTYILQVSDNTNQCAAADTVIISINNAVPQAIVQPITDIINCTNTSVQMDASASLPDGQLLYSWLLNNIVVSADSMPLAIFAGCYMVQVTNIANGCVSATQACVESNTAQPNAVIAAPAQLTCSNLTSTVNASGSSAGAGITYDWAAGPGGNITAGANTAIITVDQPGTYTITVTNTNNGCTKTAAVTVIETIQNPTALATANDELDCLTDHVSLSGLGSSLGVVYTYAWGTTAGNILSGAGGLNPSVNLVGTYTITVTNSQNGCTATAEALVTANNNVPTDIQYQIVPPTCYGECTGQIIVSGVTGGTEPYYFSIEGNVFGDIDTFQYICAGNYQLAVQDAGGCEYSFPINVIQAPQADVSLGDDIEIILGDTINLQAITNIVPGALQTVTWTPTVDTIGCNDTLCLAPTVYPPTSTTYTVTVIDTNGCTATDQIFIHLDKPERVFVPTTFTPNNDGFNDLLLVYTGTDVDRILSFRIFDRWGELMFRRDDVTPNSPFDGWDGNLRGLPLTPGVFVYYLEVRFRDGHNEIYKGDITLLK